jgi:N-acetyl-anhydromuramyl-L-alanine amidase AmpD
MRFGCLLLLAFTLAGCVRHAGKLLPRKGDEIIVCGQLFHTGTRVITWMDPGGYDAYRVERRFTSLTNSDWAAILRSKNPLESPNRYSLRRDGLDATQVQSVRGGGWQLEDLRERVDQFVIHFDATGTSRRCFEVLHDERGLSVHFMLDVDGTLYQTLDLKERAWHATTSNTRSVGIEIAQAGAFPVTQRRRLEPWYTNDASGVRLIFPQWMQPTGIATPDFIGRPARPDPVIGRIQDIDLIQYDFTPQQYAALARLSATLTRIFPRLRPDFPRHPDGSVTREVLPPDQLNSYRGILGHYHVQANKVDPGPAFDWNRLEREMRRVR